MIAALLLLVSTRQAATVTFTHPCAHSSVVLAAFGKQIGETIKPSGSVLKDYFLVRFDAMPVEDAKKAISKALNATWIRSGSVLLLTRTGGQEQAEERALRARFREAIAKAIKEAKDNEAARKPFNLPYLIDELRGSPKEEWWDSFAYTEEPSHRLRDRLIATLNVDQVMSLPVGTTVYSTNPKTDEVPLTPGMRRVYETFRAECELWRTAQDTVFDEEDDRRSFGMHMGTLDETASFVLDVDRHSVSISMEFDTPGSSTSMGGGGIESYDDEESNWSKFYDGVKGLADADDATREAWRQPRRDDEFFYGWGGDEKLRKRQDLGKLLNRIVQGLEDNEPLSLLSSWPIIQAAQERGTNIVALMSDDLIEWAFECEVKKETPLLSVLESLWWPPKTEYDADLKCWLAGPDDRPATRKSRVDRQAFARLLRSAASNGWIRLDNMADYVARTDAEEVYSGWSKLVRLARQLDLSGYSWTNIDLATRIYATIPAAQRRSAWEGGIDVPIQNWPPKLLRLIKENDWDNDRLSPQDPESMMSERDGRMIAALVKAGLPNGTMIRIKVEQAPEVWVMRDRNGSSYDIDSIGWVVVSVEDDEETPQKIDKFAEGTRESLSIELIVPGLGTHSLASTFSYVPFEDDLKPIDQLPAKLQQSIKDSIARARGGVWRPTPRLL